ncbi:MAG: YbaK/EbsC family protein [Patescibacteria group bacterium]|jgi:Ala-tRNA(Pro) deacylase
MAISKRLLTTLDKNKVKYDVVPHKTVYTVHDLGQTLKQKVQTIAKTLLVKVDKEYYLVVLPAHYNLDFGKVKKALKAKNVSMAKEGEMKTKFKVKPGAMVPFGFMHKLEVLLDRSLLRAEKVLFGAGTFTDSLRMKVKDFVKVQEVQTGDYGKKKSK